MTKGQQVLDLAAKGLTARQIGDRVGWQPGNVYKALSSAGIKARDERNLFDWTEARIAHALELRKEGLSYEQIGQALGTTKNAVVGRFKRLGLLRPAAEVEAERRLRREVVPKAVTPAPKLRKPSPRPRAKVERPEPPAEHAVNLLARRPGQCCWPIGPTAGAETLFCGSATKEGDRWCEYHRTIGYAARAA